MVHESRRVQQVSRCDTKLAIIIIIMRDQTTGGSTLAGRLAD